MISVPRVRGIFQPQLLEEAAISLTVGVTKFAITKKTTIEATIVASDLIYVLPFFNGYRTFSLSYKG
jgi:hypothetical protein